MITESAVQSAIRAEAARWGIHLWRNNVGVALHPDGNRPVRYGLANDSKQLNQTLKSADLIGWTRTGKFISIECKKPGGGNVEPAQEAWRRLVLASGGYAFITDDPRGIPWPELR